MGRMKRDFACADWGRGKVADSRVGVWFMRRVERGVRASAKHKKYEREVSQNGKFF